MPGSLQIFVFRFGWRYQSTKMLQNSFFTFMQHIFCILLALTERRTYQNDMKPTFIKSVNKVLSLTLGFITMGNFTTISSRTLGVRATTCMKYPIWIKSHLKIQQVISSNNTIWADCHTNFDSIQKTTRVKKLMHRWSKFNLI